MSLAIRCDCCGRTTPDVNPKYSRLKRWQWFEFNEDSQGGSDFKLDICEKCWKAIAELSCKESSDAQ